MNYKLALLAMAVWAVAVWFVVTDEREVCEVNYSADTCTIALK